MLPAGRAQVTNPQSAETMTPEERARRRRQLTEQAVKLAMEGRREEAGRLNKENIRLLEKDPGGYKRTGQAPYETGRVAEAEAA